MASEVILKKSSVVGKVPQLTDLQYGQVAINYSDCKMYFKTADNQIQYFVSPQKISGEGLATPTYIDFDVASTATPQRGRLWYNGEDDTLNLGHDNGVVQQIGQEFFLPPCLNNSGVEIANGSFVMSTGSQGDKITIAKAVTDGTYAPEYMLGIATHTVAIGTEFADIVTNGIVRDIDTSLWPIGTLLYPNPAVPGGLTSTKPDAPAIRTPIAIVLRQHAVTGRIYVRMAWASKLGDTDSNVKFTSLANEDLLVYESSTGLWKNATIASLGRVAGSTSGGFVRYNGTTNLAGTLYGGSTTPNGTTRLNYSGYFYPSALNLAGTGDTSTVSTHYFVETGTDGFVRPKALANVQSEIVTTSVLGSGTANSTTFLRGDRTWAPFTGATMHVGVTPPADPQNGNLWWNTEIGRLLVYYVDGDSSQWVDASPSIEGPAGVGVPSGGTTSQALVKTSNLDYETEWQHVALLESTHLGSRNRFINPGFNVTTRGSSFTSTPGNTYTADQWIVADAGAGLSVTVDLTGYENALTKAGASGHSIGWLAQPIERANIRDLVGPNGPNTITVSIDITCGNPCSGAITLKAAQGGNDFSNQIVVGSISWTHPGGGITERKFATFNLSAACANGIVVYFEHGAIGSGSYIRFSRAKCEPGTIATPYYTVPIYLDIMACQRYYEVGMMAIWQGQQASYRSSSYIAFQTWKYKTPSVTFSITENNGYRDHQVNYINLHGFNFHAICQTSTADGRAGGSWAASALLM